MRARRVGARPVSPTTPIDFHVILLMKEATPTQHTTTVVAADEVVLVESVVQQVRVQKQVVRLPGFMAVANSNAVSINQLRNSTNRNMIYPKTQSHTSKMTRVVLDNQPHPRGSQTTIHDISNQPTPAKVRAASEVVTAVILSPHRHQCSVSLVFSRRAEHCSKLQELQNDSAEVQ
jgi:hypothetical protein